MKSYDEIIELVSDKITEYSDDNSFSVLAKIDKELGLPLYK